jgi:hypothetical protein
MLGTKRVPNSRDRRVAVLDTALYTESATASPDGSWLALDDRYYVVIHDLAHITSQQRWERPPEES